MEKKYQTDMRIVQRYLNKDPRAEKWLFKELQKFILNLMKVMEHKGFSFSDKDNIVAELIYQIMVLDNQKVLRSYWGQCKLSSYLWPIVRNRIIDAFRKEVRYHSREIPQELPEESHPFQDESTSSIETIIEEHISNQPPVEQYIKIAKWIEGLSYNQIMNNAKKEFSDEVSINFQRIAYVLQTNRRDLQKKLKKYNV